MERLEFFFDPGCPWTWITSRWIVEVAPRRDLDVRWRPFSLTIKNEGTELPPGIPEPLRARIEMLRPVTLGALRVFQAAREAEGDEPLGALYTEYGRRIHHDDAAGDPAFLGASLQAAGLDPALAEAADDESRDDALRAAIGEASGYAGEDVGSPILVFDTEPRRGFSGPIMSPAPRGDEALRLWDHLRALVEHPGLFELKRGRDAGPVLPPAPA